MKRCAMDEEQRKRRATNGGVGVILVTGVLAVTGMGLTFQGAVGTTLWVVMGVVTLGGVWLMIRFIARHGDEIGEARFDTRNKTDGDEPGTEV
jgi:hypothetical protein